jgi:hypothetical protein
MKALSLLFLFTFLCVFSPVQAEQRTAGRAVTGERFYDGRFFMRAEHEAFSAIPSNHDAQHQHPAQWAGQDWDTAAWNAEKWTPEIAIRKLYAGGVFHRAHLRSGKIPVLEVGPQFFRLSDLDRRRSLKLLTDHEGLFSNGRNMVELRDWHTHQSVGSYTPQGLYLN